MGSQVTGTEASHTQYHHHRCPKASLTHCSASISQEQQSCHCPCCSCPPLGCVCVMLWRFQIIACASPICKGRREQGEQGVKEKGEGGVAVPRRLLRSSRSIIDWLIVWQEALQKIRQKNTMRREVTVELSSQGFWKTGIRSDVCQVTPVSCVHARTNTLTRAHMPQYGVMARTCDNTDLHAHVFT